MNNVVFTLLLALTACVRAQTPCSSLDDGPFLATSPTLTVDIKEATARDLATSPNAFRGELRLRGQVGTEIDLEVMPDYSFFNPEDTFRFVTVSGVNYVQMYSPLDRDGPTAAIDDDVNVFSFTLKCSLKSNMSNYRYFDTKIFVTDVNDNDPMFTTNLTSELHLNELTPTGMTVLTLRAEDKDTGSNLTYSILTSGLAGDMSGQFSVDSMTGELSLQQPLDYETMMQGTLVLTVADQGSPARTSTATVEVRVEDGDDQGPVFVYPGCWNHRQRCSWPKYTSSTSLKQGQAISVLPVPNKVKAAVSIRAKDLDNASNPISFSIASTIPPGSESKFTVTTTPAGNGEYEATITPLEDMAVNHGFEIFLQAEEQSEHKRFEVAMIFFENPNSKCSSGTSSGNASSQSGSETKDDVSQEKYTEPIVALIVVAAILSTLVLCLAVAVFSLMRRRKQSSGDVDLTRM